MLNLFDVRDSDSPRPLSPTEEVVLDRVVAAEMASDEISAALHEVPSTNPRFTLWRREPSPGVIVHKPFKREMATEQTHRVSAFSAKPPTSAQPPKTFQYLVGRGLLQISAPQRTDRIPAQ